MEFAEDFGDGRDDGDCGEDAVGVSVDLVRRGGEGVRG